MMEAFQALSTIFSFLLSWENCAVLLAIVYLLLVVRENTLCWYCALVSSLIFAFLFWDVSLLMESALNVYYVVMAIYGWYQWKLGGKGNSGVLIHTINFKQHLLIIFAVVILSFISGSLLEQNTDAAWPYIDSFTTWGSVATTIMVTRKIIENWLYWLLIDSVSIFLYIDRALYSSAALFAVYLVIVVFGYFKWRQLLAEQGRKLADVA
jgi:nicotinamide mononucleotide transporter